ncbi:MAG: ammonia channel protein, partial [Deltaproteobacteria bacterium]|nr:ammonia channel protein [Deltaproteobacteria bacterium]
MKRLLSNTLVFFITLLVPVVACADVVGSTAHKISSGDTAFVLVATALVMLMTPGLALFYGGMV